jgi:uncharacterized protein
MGQPISNLSNLIQFMEPVLHEGVYVFAVMPLGTPVEELAPIASIREQEGITIVVPEETAAHHGLTVAFRAAWITLMVHSDLEAVGLTAAFATALGQAGISCNVIAGAYHDHIFVPVGSAKAAMVALQALQQSAP